MGIKAIVDWPGKILLSLSLVLLAVQCQRAPLPPLPAPSSRPALPVALLAPTSGELATFGRMLRNGSLMAFDEWNTRGGVLGHRLVAVDYDTDCAYKTAEQLTQQATREGHKFIIGPLCTQAAIAAAQVAQANQALMLAPAATHPLVTVSHSGQTRSTIFRASLAHPQQGQAAASFAVDQLSARQAAVLVGAGDDYSTALAEAFAQQFAVLGGAKVEQYAYHPGDPDFKPAFRAMAQAGAQVLYLPAPVSVVNRVTAQWRELGLSSQITLLGSDSWESPELDLKTSEGSYFTVHFFLEDGRPDTRAWAEAYQAKFAVAPTTLAALGYEATTILAAAIQAAAAVEVMPVAQTLEQSLFEGIAGPLTFDSQHNPRKSVPVVRVQGGRLVLASYVYPPRKQ
jgi:branched-chain amino acid transport system substrate-binding protein